MIWLSISLFMCTLVVCIMLLILKMVDKAYGNAISCLEDLCDTLNEKFPGSTLNVVSNKGNIKVTGELKYLKKNAD